MRTPINADDIVRTQMTRRLSSEEHSIVIHPPGLLLSTSDNDVENYETCTHISGIDESQKEINVALASKNKNKRISVTQIDTKSKLTNVKKLDTADHSKKIYNGLTNLLNATLKKDLLAKQNELNQRSNRSNKTAPSENSKAVYNTTTQNVNSNILNGGKKSTDTKYSTSIVLNLDKYKVQDSNTNMVSIPAAPKKYNTFVANDASVGGGKKETMNVGFGDMPKPVGRTGSTVNANTIKQSAKNPAIIRRHNPKEFLSATMSPRDSNEYKTPLRTPTTITLENVSEEINVGKSLPSYDEALKRTVYDNTTTNTNLSRAPSAKVSADCPVHGSNPAMNAKQMNLAASTPVLSTGGTLVNGQRTPLPTLTSQQQQQMLISKQQANGLVISNAPKTYFKPHDLNSQQQQQVPTTRHSASGSLYTNGGTPSTPSQSVVEAYNSQKSAIDRLYSGVPTHKVHLAANRLTQQQQLTQTGGYLQQSSIMQMQYTSNTKPNAPPPPAPTPVIQVQASPIPPVISAQQQQQQQQMRTSAPTNHTSNASTPRAVTSRPNSSAGAHPQQQHQQQQQDHQTWKVTANDLIKKPNEIEIVNSNINNTLNKHINEDILQLQARDAYSITGSSNGSGEYQNQNQQPQQQLQQQPSFKLQPQTQMTKQQVASTEKLVSNSQQQFILKQQQQQQGPSVPKPTTIQLSSNANLAFIEEDTLNKNIPMNRHQRMRTSESFDDENNHLNGIDGDDDDDGASSTLSTNSSLPRIKQQQQQKQHFNTNEKSKALLKNNNMEPDYGRIYSGIGNSNIAANQNPNSLNTKLAVNLQNQIASANSLISGSMNNNLPTAVAKTGASRPPCRLQFYEKDSDTNTNSEISPSLAGGVPSLTGSLGQPPIGNAISGISKTYPALMKEAKSNGNMLSDSPDLSELSSAVNGAGGGGGRTSTPNLSKRKRSSSVSSRDFKLMRRQIEDLEKMYQEILRLLEADNKSMNSKDSPHSSTTISSFTSSKDINGKKPRRFMSAHIQQTATNETSSKSYELKQINHRFSRLENHVITLAKTVAHISSEVQSIKSIEEEIYNMRKDMNNLQYLNLPPNFVNNPSVRSLSEPNHNQNVNTNNILYNNNNLQAAATGEQKATTHNSNSHLFTHHHHQQPHHDLDKDRLNKLVIPSFTNPRRLRKLTKFFGEEPPMLRLFLQKLGYENYATNFENERITITELPYCSEERLKTLGIPLGPRLRILQEAQTSFRHENYNIFLV